MITKQEILKLARERGACEKGLVWYEDKPQEALLTWEAIRRGFYGWVAQEIPEAIPYLQRLPERIKKKSLESGHKYIRVGMAYIGYRLDVLKDDPELEVRSVVASKGYALEQLKDDMEAWIRSEVARQGHSLEQLKDDPRWEVRMAVAKKGYALEQLKDDPNWNVCDVARAKLKEMQQ